VTPFESYAFRESEGIEGKGDDPYTREGSWTTDAPYFSYRISIHEIDYHFWKLREIITLFDSMLFLYFRFFENKETNIISNRINKKERHMR
jgi:hypothetical protein